MDSSTDTPDATRPTGWPGAFGIYKVSKAVVKPNIWTIVWVSVLTGLISLGLSMVVGRSITGRAIYYVASLLVGAAETSVFISLYLRSAQGEVVSFDSALSRGLPYFARMLGLNILVGLSVALSFVLLIVPFFFVFPRLYLAPYFLIDKNLGVIDAYKASWAQTEGHIGKVWGVIGVFLLITLLFITIIGIPFAIYFELMFSASFVVLYKFITGDSSLLAADQTKSVPPSKA